AGASVAGGANVAGGADLTGGPELAKGPDGGRARQRHRLASGLVRDVEVTSGTVPVDGRDLVYLIVHDVTTERMATDALRLRSAALEAVGSALVITDRQGVIEWVNPAFTELYGYTAEEAVGRTPGELMKSGEHDVAFYRELWDTIVAGHTWRGRVTNRRRDGTVFEEEMAITPLFDGHGRIAHFIAVKRDLSAWLEMEQRLAVGQKLETVGRLAGGVAHDFNNLLTVINGTLDLVLHELPAGHPVRGDLDEVRRAGDRAAGLTRQLLAFGRRQLQVPEVVGLNDVITGMMGMLRRLIGEDIRVELELSEDLAPVYADTGQLEQVFLNLMVNARDAMPGGGTITVETRNVAPDGVRLVVRDTGPGIDRAILSRIFDPFFTTKEQGAGSGLGLATVYGIVAQCGGSVSVESPPGDGAVFEVVLPRSTVAPPEAAPSARADARASEPAGVADAGAGDAEVDAAVVAAAHVVPGDPVTDGPSILVVEDDDAIRSVAGRALQRGGYGVVTAAGGADALALLEAEPGIRLLFTDVVMPGMSGPELARRATSRRPHLRVLFASGYTDESLERHGVHESGHAFLEKPYSVTALLAAASRALE
ncbi:MAG TPA: ATP-binding protein, partial [Longimicrobiales bacterium]|nr:ATP-binding protein [Longimicrobiales bacterium]